jgi:hypothetical protein
MRKKLITFSFIFMSMFHMLYGQTTIDRTDYLRFSSDWELHPLTRIGDDLVEQALFPFFGFSYRGGPMYAYPELPDKKDPFTIEAEVKNIGSSEENEVVSLDASVSYTTFELGDVLNGQESENQGFHLIGVAEWFNIIETGLEWETFQDYSFFNLQINIIDLSWLDLEAEGWGWLQPQSIQLYNLIRIEGEELRNYSYFMETGFLLLPFFAAEYANPPDMWVFSPQIFAYLFWFRPFISTNNSIWSGFELTFDLYLLFDPEAYFEGIQQLELFYPKISSSDIEKGDVSVWLFGLTIRDQVYDPFTEEDDTYLAISVSQYGFEFLGSEFFFVMSFEEGIYLDRCMAQLLQGKSNRWSIFIKADVKMAIRF